MARVSLITASVALVAIVGCGGATTTPTSVPSATAAPTVAASPTQGGTGPSATDAIPTRPPGATPTQTVGATGDCASVPALAPGSTPGPSSVDPTLESRFPAQIDGQPVTNVSSWFVWQIICAYGGPTVLGAWQQDIPVRFGFVFTTLSYATGQVTVDGSPVQLRAFRATEFDTTILEAMLVELTQMVAGQPVSGYQLEESTATLGGKQVRVWELDGTVRYSYASGDTLYVLAGVDQAHAETVFAALP